MSLEQFLTEYLAAFSSAAAFVRGRYTAFWYFSSRCICQREVYHFLGSHELLQLVNGRLCYFSRVPIFLLFSSFLPRSTSDSYRAWTNVDGRLLLISCRRRPLLFIPSRVPILLADLNCCVLCPFYLFFHEDPLAVCISDPKLSCPLWKKPSLDFFKTMPTWAVL